jgi:hypothetical protein
MWEFIIILIIAYPTYKFGLFVGKELYKLIYR